MWYNTSIYTMEDFFGKGYDVVTLSAGDETPKVVNFMLDTGLTTSCAQKEDSEGRIFEKI